MRNWIEQHPDTYLVIIDTFEKIRNSKRKSNLYAEDYGAVGWLKSIADEYGISIIVVHHERKMKSEDPLDMVSGTTGLTGAADTIAMLQKSRGSIDAELILTGRDIDEKRLALKFDKTATRWLFMGGADEYRLTPERLEILEILKKNKESMSTSQIAKKIGKKDNTVSNHLKKLVEAGSIKQVGFGKYAYRDNFKSGESDESSS